MPQSHQPQPLIHIICDIKVNVLYELLIVAKLKDSIKICDIFTPRLIGKLRKSFILTIIRSQQRWKLDRKLQPKI